MLGGREMLVGPKLQLGLWRFDDDDGIAAEMHWRSRKMNRTIVLQICTMGKSRALNTMVHSRSARYNILK